MHYELITILGPTASGKTAVAAQLAARIDGEVISADSRQVYRGMDVGTGKDLAEYVVGGVPILYHLIDIVDAGYKYSVYEFQRDFRQAFNDIRSRKKTPILCGGSGMYVEAAVNGYNLPEVPPDPQLRVELELLTDEELKVKLVSLKAQHNRSDLDTRKRTIRAIEIALHEQQMSNSNFQPIKNLYVGISVDREARRARITERLHARLRAGMVQEVEKLLASGISADSLEYYGLEYRFVTAHLTGKLSYDEMVQQLNVAIHQFAKRQMTWFRHMERNGAIIHWIDVFLPMEEKLKKIQELMTAPTQ